MSAPFYIAVEFWFHYMTGDEKPEDQLMHNVIASPEELAKLRSQYEGHEHRIVGFYTAEEVAEMTLEERGLSEEQVAPATQSYDQTALGLMQEYQDHRDKANALALHLEKMGFAGYYVRPDGTMGDLDPKTRPTQFVFRWKPTT